MMAHVKQSTYGPSTQTRPVGRTFRLHDCMDLLANILSAGQVLLSIPNMFNTYLVLLLVNFLTVQVHAESSIVNVGNKNRNNKRQSPHILNKAPTMPHSTKPQQTRQK